jgi:hypothetical protein
VLGVAVLAAPALGLGGILMVSVLGFWLCVGAGLFVAISVLTGATWWRGLEPLAVAGMEAVWRPAIPLIATLALGLGELYPWARPDAHADHLLHAKAAWLNPPFFLARALLVALALWALGHWLGSAVRASRPAIRAAAAYVLAAAAGLSVSAWDWVMSLEPAWYSTMFGIYAFAGAFAGAIAALTVTALLLHRAGRLPLSPSQCHDLGKLLFAFTFFWGYIWYCQGMLIWYANLPEETSYMALRAGGAWALLFWLNPILNFVVPFVVLLSARVKHNESALLQVAMVVLAGRWLDTYLMVLPPLDPVATFPWGAFAATGLGLLLINRWLEARVA